MVLMRHIANYGEYISGNGNGLPLSFDDLLFVKNEIRNKLRLITAIKKEIDGIELEVHKKI